MAATEFHSVSTISISEAKTAEKNKNVCQLCDILQLDLLEVWWEFQSNRDYKNSARTGFNLAHCVQNSATGTGPNNDEQLTITAKTISWLCELPREKKSRIVENRLLQSNGKPISTST